jgi:hypothetical protein
MLTGELAFPGPSMAALLNQHLNIPPIPPASRVQHIPPALNDHVLSLLAKDPADRPPSTTWVLEALTRIRDSARDLPDPGPPLAEHPAQPAKPARRPLKPARQASGAMVPPRTDGAAITATAGAAISVTVPRFQPRPPRVLPVRPVTAIACAPLGPELRVFALTSDGRIRHCSGSDPLGSWSDVLAPTGQQPVAAIAATSAHPTYYSVLADQTSALAAVSDDGLYISRSGSAWRSIDGPGGHPLSAHIVGVAVASWTRAAWNSQPGEARKPPSPVNVFALDADGKIWKNSRSGWIGVPVSRPAKAIAACSYRDKDQLVLCVADGAVSVAHYDTQSGAASSLPAWQGAPAVRVMDVACLSLAADHQEAFALDADGNIWHARSLPPAHSGPGQPSALAPWMAWTRIEGTPADVTAIAAGSQSGSGSPDGDYTSGTLLLATADGTIHHSSADLATTRQSAWTGWSQLPPL